MSDRQISVGGSPDNQRFVVTFPRDPLKREFELAVTLRMPPLNTRLPDKETPTLEELEIIQARTILNWSNVMASLIFDVPLPELRFAGIDAVRMDDENESAGIVESDGDMPYVTVFNLTNFYNPGLHVTVHSYDDGSMALALAQSYIRGMERFNAYLAKNAESGNGGIIRVGMKTQSEFPTPENTNRIGRNAEILPDTSVIHATNAFIRTTKEGQFDNTISLEDGQTVTPNWDKQAQIANTPYHATQVQYKHNVRVAYPITGLLSVGQWEDGKRYVNIPTTNASIRISYQERSPNQNFPTTWENMVTKLGLADETLKVGVKIKLDADYVVMKCDSEKDGVPRMDKSTPPKPVQYKNFKGFYLAIGKTRNQLPERNNDQSHQDWDTFNPESSSDYRLPDNQDISF